MITRPAWLTDDVYDRLYEAVAYGGSGHMEPESYYEAVTDRVVGELHDLIVASPSTAKAMRLTVEPVAVETMERWGAAAFLEADAGERHVHAVALAKLMDLHGLHLVGEDGWPTPLGHDTMRQLELLEQARSRTRAERHDVEWKRTGRQCGACEAWVPLPEMAAHEQLCWPVYP